MEIGGNIGTNFVCIRWGKKKEKMKVVTIRGVDWWSG
jgi:hypothetical protein